MSTQSVAIWSAMDSLRECLANCGVADRRDPIFAAAVQRLTADSAADALFVGGLRAAVFDCLGGGADAVERSRAFVAEARVVLFCLSREMTERESKQHKQTKEKEQVVSGPGRAAPGEGQPQARLHVREVAPQRRRRTCRGEPRARGVAATGRDCFRHLYLSRWLSFSFFSR